MVNDFAIDRICRPRVDCAELILTLNAKAGEEVFAGSARLVYAALLNKAGSLRSRIRESGETNDSPLSYF